MRTRVSSGVVYGVTSPHPTAAQPLAYTRGHWGIENGLHYRRGVTYHEDATRMTKGRAGQVMATLNNLVLGLLNRARHTNHAHARRLYSADLAAALAPLTLPSRL